MSRSERLDLEIGEMKLRLCAEQQYRCACGCGWYVVADQCDLAHRIPQSKPNLKKYGEVVIHNRLNMGAVVAGSLSCNKKIELGKAHIAEQRELLERIYADMEDKNEVD